MKKETKRLIINRRIGSVDLYTIDGMTLDALIQLLGDRLGEARFIDKVEGGELVLNYHTGWDGDAGEFILSFRRPETDAEMQDRLDKNAKAAVLAKEKRRKDKLAKEEAERALFEKLSAKYGPKRTA